MNEKKKLKGLPKRILSLVLTFAMVFTLMPMTPGFSMLKLFCIAYDNYIWLYK